MESRYSQENIGKNARVLYEYLSKKGIVNLAELKDDMGMRYNDMIAAVGWLQRDGKLEIVKEGNKRTVNIKIK